MEQMVSTQQQRGKLCALPRRIAKLRRMKYRGTAVKACVTIMGKAKTTVKLDRPVGGKAICCIRRRLCHAHGDFANALIAKTIGSAV
jgi:hypothetical protein